MAAIPGDWYIGRSDSESYPVKDQMRCVFSGQPDGERYMVAKVWAGDDGDYEGTARLVAAAPQLLAVCKLLLGGMGEVIEDHNEVAYSDLRMAIMRAEGET